MNIADCIVNISSCFRKKSSSIKLNIRNLDKNSFFGENRHWNFDFGAGRENITVLAERSAAGIASDPLIIFKGKSMQSSWIGDQALPNTYYGKSENGMFLHILTFEKIVFFKQTQIQHEKIRSSKSIYSFFCLIKINN